MRFLRRADDRFVDATPADREAMVDEVDRQLDAIRPLPRHPGTRERIDQLLDERLGIRPPRVCAPANVPVIPGSPS